MINMWQDLLLFWVQNILLRRLVVQDLEVVYLPSWVIWYTSDPNQDNPGDVLNYFQFKHSFSLDGKL